MKIEKEISITGTPNLGAQVERTEKFVIYSGKTIVIKDSKGNLILSFNPFFDGGSILIKDFNSIIIDVEHWGEDKDKKFKMLSKEEIVTSSTQVLGWKEDSEKLEKIREAYELLAGDE